jgi:hypothetical protein
MKHATDRHNSIAHTVKYIFEEWGDVVQLATSAYQDAAPSERCTHLQKVNTTFFAHEYAYCFDFRILGCMLNLIFRAKCAQHTLVAISQCR